MINQDRLARAAPTLMALGIMPDDGETRILRALRDTDGGARRKLLGSSYKCDLGEAESYLTAVQYLAPATEAGVQGRTMCPNATEGCASTCIVTTGQMLYPTHSVVRIKKTLLLYLFPDEYFEALKVEVAKHAIRARARSLRPAVRLNGTSDYPFWNPKHGLLEMGGRGGAQLYDYTKSGMTRPLVAAMDEGWHFTYSWSESPEAGRRARNWSTLGVNTAVVVSGRLGSTRTVAEAVATELVRRGEWHGREVTDGDKHDLRFLDPASGGWVILAAKGGKAKMDSTGFVVRFDEDRLLGTDASVVDCIINEKAAA